MIKQLWDFLNGKKTVIGAVIVFIVAGLQAVEAQLGFSLPVDPFLQGALSFGEGLIGVGLAHKVYKSTQ